MGDRAAQLCVETIQKVTLFVETIRRSMYYIVRIRMKSSILFLAFFGTETPTRRVFAIIPSVWCLTSDRFIVFGTGSAYLKRVSMNGRGRMNEMKMTGLEEGVEKQGGLLRI